MSQDGSGEQKIKIETRSYRQSISSELFIHITIQVETYLFKGHTDQITFHFHIGFPLVEPSPKRFAVIFCALLGSEIQAILMARVNVAQLINAARARTELATILRPKNKSKELECWQSKGSLFVTESTPQRNNPDKCCPCIYSLL